MKKINYLFIIFVLFLFVSCKSKKNVVSTLPRPVLNVDSVRPDSSAAIDDLFAPDQSTSLQNIGYFRPGDGNGLVVAEENSEERSCDRAGRT